MSADAALDAAEDPRRDETRGPDSLLNEEFPTLPALFQKSYTRHAHKHACARERGHGWTPLTYGDLGDAVDLLARGLHLLGVRKGHRVAILLKNSPEWIFADHAILHLGAVTVPLYTTNTPEANAFILKDAFAKLLFTDAAGWMGLASHRDALPDLGHVVTLDAIEGTTPWADVTKQARSHKEREPDFIETSVRAVKPRDLATLVYTSGTTGTPKGVMLTHENLAYNVVTAKAVLGLDDSARAISILPLSHSFERIVEAVGVHVGGTAFYLEEVTPERVRSAMRSVRPTALIGVPRIFEKIRDGILAQVAAQAPWKRRLFALALDGGHASAEREIRGRSPTLAARLLRRLVLGKLHERFGGNLRLAVSGGAPLREDVARFFWAIGIPLLEGYGLTEASPILALNAPGAARFGSVGRALPGTTLRLREDGELLAQGPGIMQGYWNRPDETRESLVPGDPGERVRDSRDPLAPAGVPRGDGPWLATGDLATVDDEKFVRITGRKKEILVLANGKNVAPAAVEAALEADSLVLQAVALGDARPHVAALIVPDMAVLAAILGRSLRAEGIMEDPDARRALDAAIEKANSRLAKHDRVRAWRVVAEPFQVEDGSLTPTLKVKRGVVLKRHVALIDSMYGESPPRA